MKQEIRIFMLVLLLSTIGCASVSKEAKSPATQAKSVGVRTKQVGNQIQIIYDLEGLSQYKYHVVKLKVSSNGGQSYDIIPKTLSGNIGTKVAPGKNKVITWDVLKDVEHLHGANFVFLIETYPFPQVRLRTKAKGLEMHEQVGTPIKNLMIEHDFENSFVDNDDGTYSDRVTGLMWLKRPVIDGVKLKSSSYYPQTLNRLIKGFSFAGYSDWRVPTLQELSSYFYRVMNIESWAGENGREGYPAKDWDYRFAVSDIEFGKRRALVVEFYPKRLRNSRWFVMDHELMRICPVRTELLNDEIAEYKYKFVPHREIRRNRSMFRF